MAEKRSKQALYINTTPSTTATYVLLATGIDAAEVDYSPKTETSQDINADTATTNLVGYEPKISITQKFGIADPAFIFINTLRRNRALLSAAETDIILVDLYETPTGTTPNFIYPNTEKQPVSVAINKYGGEGGGYLTIDFDLNYKGDATKGTFNVGTKVFTAV